MEEIVNLSYYHYCIKGETTNGQMLSIFIFLSLLHVLNIFVLPSLQNPCTTFFLSCIFFPYILPNLPVLLLILSKIFIFHSIYILLGYYLFFIPLICLFMLFDSEYFVGFFSLACCHLFLSSCFTLSVVSHLWISYITLA